MQLGEGIFVAPPYSEEDEKKNDGKVHVKVRCSVFFDGTLNNRINTAERIANSSVYQQNKVKTLDNSYENDITNVAKMEPYIDQAKGFDHTLGLYIEGPGTEDREGDATRGYAFGGGSTGVKAKVNIGMTKTVNEIARHVEDEAVIEELVVDVFGFSRGAAGARFFVHEVLNDKPTYLSTGHSVIELPANPLVKRLQAQGFEINKSNIKIQFVGLYDTVASEGLAHWNDTYSLKLDAIGRSEVKKVIHLVAADEHRANFSMTDISSAGGKGKEIFLPGVHSDIGGSYLKSSDENGLVLNSAFRKSTLEKDRLWLVAAGWYRPDQIRIESPAWYVRATPGASALPSRPDQHKLKAYRSNIGCDYDKIPLHIMADFARKEGVALKSKLEDKHSIPPNLTNVFNILQAYANGGGSKVEDWFNQTPPEWLFKVRNQYFHFSAHYTLTYGVYPPNKPNFESGRRVRNTHEG